MADPVYRRILLKLSGEAFAGDDNPIDGKVAEFVAVEIVEARSLGVEVAVVVGGGNIWRGMTGAGAGMDRAALESIVEILAVAGRAVDEGRAGRAQRSGVPDRRARSVVVEPGKRASDVVLVARGNAEADDIDREIDAFLA